MVATLPDFPRANLESSAILMTVDNHKIFTFGGKSSDPAHSSGVYYPTKYMLLPLIGRAKLHIPYI